MKIENQFTVHVPIDVAWKVLTDLEGIAPCLPGAQLTGVDGDVYKGKVKVKVGPVISEFAGTARFAEKDDQAYRGVIDAKGRDARSAGNAAALITAQLRPEGDATVVNVDTDLKISGKLAQFGSGMIKEVSEKLMGQFVTALEAKIAADQTGPAGAESAVGSGAAEQPAAGDTTPAGSDVDLPAAPPEPGQAEPDPQRAKTTRSATAEDLREARLDARRDAPESSVEAADEGVTDTPILHPGGSGTLSAVADNSRVPDDEPAAAPSGPTVHLANGQAAAPLISPAASRPRSSGVASPSASPSTAASPAAATSPSAVASAEPEPLDLLALAGGSIRKRLIPVAIGAAVVVAAVIVWRVVR